MAGSESSRKKAAEPQKWTTFYTVNAAQKLKKIQNVWILKKTYGDLYWVTIGLPTKQEHSKAKWLALRAAARKPLSHKSGPLVHFCGWDLCYF